MLPSINLKLKKKTFPSISPCNCALTQGCCVSSVASNQFVSEHLENYPHDKFMKLRKRKSRI